VIADFRDLLATFAGCGVRFLVVGAHALAAHGVPRVTGDLDLWVEPSAANAARAWRALAEFGAPLDTLAIRESDLVEPERVIQLGLPPYRIDLLTSISEVDFADAWTGRLEGTLHADQALLFSRKQSSRFSSRRGHQEGSQAPGGGDLRDDGPGGPVTTAAPATPRSYATASCRQSP